jgi:uncharacterized membrane protein
VTKLVVLTFDRSDEANEVRTKLKALQETDLLSLEDSSVIVKDEKGKIHVVDDAGKSVKTGAAVGGALGLMLGLIFPVAGIVTGALAGALVGRALGKGVDSKFVKEVSESLKPGHSALFLDINEANVSAVLAALKPYSGTAQVYQTNISPEVEESLREVLNEHATTAPQNQ